MKQEIKKICVCFFVILVCSLNGVACQYDEESIENPFAQGVMDILESTWNNNTKTATALMVDGDYVRVKQWACEHHGLLAEQLICSSISINDDIVIKNKLIRLAQLTLSDEDFKLVNNALVNEVGTWKAQEKGYILNIQSSNHKRFWITFHESSLGVSLAIYYSD